MAPHLTSSELHGAAFGKVIIYIKKLHINRTRTLVLVQNMRRMFADSGHTKSQAAWCVADTSHG